MKNRESGSTAQSAYLLEYGRRKIRVCADTFQNLAQIFAEDRSEAEGQEAAGQDTGLPDASGREDMRQKRTVLFLRKSLEKERQLFAGNLKEMAAMMNRAAEESVRFIRLGSRRQKQIIRGLAGEGLNAREIYLVQRGDGRMELSILLSARPSRNRGARTVDEAAGCLSVLLDMRLVSAKRNPFFIGEEPVCYFFEEEPEYVYLTGTARAVKETETVSGDNFAFFEAGDAQLVLALSDGMGSGDEACRDSEAVVDMVESMLEAGLDVQMAVRLMDSAMAGEGSAENLPFPSTIDGLSITEEGVGLGGYFGAYLSIDVGSPFESGEDGMNAYIAALEKIGWTSAGTNDYGEAVYHLDGETKTYEIGLTPSSDGNSFLIYLYDPITKPIDSPLRTFLEENLVTNATLTTTETGDLYAYDMETGEMGTEVVYEYSSESLNIVTDEGMLYTNTMGGVTAGTYVENTDTGISIYQNAGTGWAHQKDEQGYTAAEYFYTPLDLATLAADLIWDETADTYTLPEDDYSLLFQVLINNGDVPASAVSNLVITFDEEKGEVTYEADILSLFQLTEDSYAAGYIHTEAVLSDIGTSVLTSPITAE